MVYTVLIGVFCLVLVVFNSLSWFTKDVHRKVTFSTIGSVAGILEGLTFIVGSTSRMVIAAGVVLVVLGFINIDNTV